MMNTDDDVKKLPKTKGEVEPSGDYCRASINFFGTVRSLNLMSHMIRPRINTIAHSHGQFVYPSTAAISSTKDNPLMICFMTVVAYPISSLLC